MEISNKKLFDELKQLNLPKKRYAVFGTGPLGIRGLIKIKDINLVVDSDLWKSLSANYPAKKSATGDYIVIDNIEIYSGWYPGKWNIQKLIDEADVINGIKFVKLKEVLKWKKIFNRPKDKKAINLIEKYFKNFHSHT